VICMEMGSWVEVSPPFSPTGDSFFLWWQFQFSTWGDTQFSQHHLSKRLYFSTFDKNQCLGLLLCPLILFQ
jgi:hypothetical protein